MTLVVFLFPFCVANLKAFFPLPVSFKGSSNVWRFCGSSVCRWVRSSGRNILQRNAEGPQHLPTSHGKAAKYLGHSLWSTWFGVRWGGMTTARSHLKNSGTVSVNKDFFHFGFGTLFLFIASFPVGRVLSVLGEGYVWFLSFHYPCVAFKCGGTVSLWIITMSVMNVSDYFSSACAPSLLFTS